MALVLNSEQLMLRDTARSFFHSEAPVSKFRTMRDSNDTWSPKLWNKMIEMGWTGIVVPEDFGGLDFGCLGSGLIFEQCGRTLANSPLLVSAVVTANLISNLASAGQKELLLPAICNGELIVSIAMAEGERWDPENTQTKAVLDSDGYRLDGRKTQVPFAEAANKYLVLARTDSQSCGGQGLSVFLVNGNESGITLNSSLKIDSYTSSEMLLGSVKVEADALLGEPGAAWSALQKALDLGAACCAAELLGIATEVFERTLDYLKQRKQFGRYIGSFQALQHRAAQLFCELEVTGSAVLNALYACEVDSETASLNCSLAKAKAAKTARLAVNEAVQMHGGIGMTDEFDIGLFVKRANAVMKEFGDYYYHADRFGRLRGY